MLVVDRHPFEEDILTIKCNYFDDYIKRLRKVPGSSFSRQLKLWEIPVGAFEEFEELFQGEIVYKVPRWTITGEAMPDYKAMYTVNNITLPTLNHELYDYQKFGVKFMVDRLLQFGFVINADDVGLGKTAQAIGAVKWIQDNKNVSRILVICKKSIRTQWRDEGFKEFVSQDAMVITGTKQKRKRDYATYNDGIMITNYHTVMNDFDELKKMKFDMIIIDEAHCVKAREGTINNSISEVCSNSKFVVFLTGTPVMSRPDDIYGIIQIVDKKFFGSWNKFRKLHIKSDTSGRFVKTAGYMNLDMLRNKVQNIIIRRTEHEVDIELPEMLPPKQVFVDKDTTQVEIEEKIREAISTLTEKLNKISKASAEYRILEASIKGLSMGYQAAANDPRLFLLSKSKNMVEKYGELTPKNYKMSSKTEAVIDIVQDVVDSGHKVIIFSKFERAARMLADDISKALKEDVLLYTGEVDDEQRDINKNLFRNDPDYKILIGTDAMAEGINLQVANHVINYDQPDTPAIKTQRFGRARRANSKHKRVYGYDMITKNSKDTERLEQLAKASSLIDGVVNLDEAQSVAMREVIAKEV